MRWSHSVCLCCFLVALAPVGLHAAVPGVETFDNDTAGWGPNTTSSTVVWIGSGGNPGGFIQTRKLLEPPVFDIGAMTTGPDFTGDYAAAGINQVSVDLNFQTANFTAAWIRFRPDPLGAMNGWRFPLTNVFPTNVWNTYGTAFDPTWTDVQAAAAGWLTDQDIDPGAVPSPTFAFTMANVAFTEVRLASPAEESALAGIDNFAIVPEPASLLLLGGMLLFLPRTPRRRR